jgi:hypothetical protein
MEGLSRLIPSYQWPSIVPRLSSLLVNTSWPLAALILLADWDVVAERAALTGGSSSLDALVVCPGLHRGEKALGLAHGEFPACAAMSSGYVSTASFRALRTL